MVKTDPEVKPARPIRPCAECGQPVDPIHRCERCRDHYWCGRHNSPYKPSSARFCSRTCSHKANDRKRAEAAAGGGD